MEKDSKSKININVKYNFMKNLENFGVHEMSINEQKVIDGGGWLGSLFRRFAPVGILLTVLEIDYGQIMEDMEAGWADGKKG
jgi:hypothetical protein